MIITYSLRTVKRPVKHPNQAKRPYRTTGQAYIMARVVIPGLGRSETWSTGYTIDRAAWSPRHRTVPGRPDIEAGLSALRERAARVWSDLTRAGQATPAEIRRHLISPAVETRPITVTDLLDRFTTREASRPNIEAATLATYRRYVSRHLVPGLTRLGLATAHPWALTSGAVERLYFALCSQGLSIDYAGKVTRYLGSAYAWACREGLAMANPCQGLRLAKSDREPLNLSADEVAVLLATARRSGIERLERVADLFEFQLLTGLNYADAVLGWPSARIETAGGVTFRVVTRAKSKALQGERLLAIVPVTDQLTDLLARYPEGLPWRSGQKLNAYLKELADLAGIRRPVSSKWARATYAQRMYDLLPREVVQALLGHRDRSTLARHYARISLERIARELRAAGLVRAVRVN